MQEFPGRPSHAVPSWVGPGSTYHIRLGTARASRASLTSPGIATALLAATRHYHAAGRWHCRLLLLMPDHLHALVVFPPDRALSAIIGAWKSFTAKQLGVCWQTNYFDHRIRNDAELDEKSAYIARNPVARRLCALECEWPWVFRGDG